MKVQAVLEGALATMYAILATLYLADSHHYFWDAWSVTAMLQITQLLIDCRPRP